MLVVILEWTSFLLGNGGNDKFLFLSFTECVWAYEPCVWKLLWITVCFSLGPACWLWDYLRRSGQVGGAFRVQRCHFIVVTSVLGDCLCPGWFPAAPQWRCGQRLHRLHCSLALCSALPGCRGWQWVFPTWPPLVRLKTGIMWYTAE